MFDGTELKTVGMLTAVVEHPLTHARRQMDFYVAAQHERAVLGMPACQEMELLTVNVDNICVVKLQSDNAGNDRCAASPSSTQTAQRSLPASQDDRRPSTSTALPSPLSKESVVKSYGDLSTSINVLAGDVHLEVDPSVLSVQMLLRRLPETIQDQVKDELDRLFREDITEPKSDGTVAMNISADGRRIAELQAETVRRHKAVEQGAEETTLSEDDCDVLPQLAKAKVYSTIGCAPGFHNLRLDKQSSALTTFITPFGRCRWKRMCFGISPASEILQAKTNEVVSG